MQESHLLHPESVTDEQISAILKKHFHKSDTKLLVQQVLTGNFPRISYPFIITGEAALPLLWLFQLLLYGLAAQNHFALQVVCIRQVFQNPAILFQRDNI